MSGSRPYLALLRGVNVGGKNMIKMAELKERLESPELTDVRTYIQSGNVLFSSSEKDTSKLAMLITKRIAADFKLDVAVAVFSKDQWRAIVEKAPKQWGRDPDWKHNLLILIEPYDMDDVVAGIGELKPDIEMLVPGAGVLYQSMSKELYGRTTTGKLAASPAYKQMTIRNHNTATKLLELL